MKGHISNIRELTVENQNFRKVLYTTEKSQLVLMCIEPGDDIGEEVHKDNDQFIKCEKGTGKIYLGDTECAITEGMAAVVPAGIKHNVVNTSSDKRLKIYTIYSPAHHKDKVVHRTKEVAEADGSEHFDGHTTEK